MNLAPPGTAAGVCMLGGVPGTCCCAVALVWGSHSASTEALNLKADGSVVIYTVNTCFDAHAKSFYYMYMYMILILYRGKVHIQDNEEAPSMYHVYMYVMYMYTN